MFSRNHEVFLCYLGNDRRYIRVVQPKRIEAMPAFEKKLVAFRKRCRRLRVFSTSKKYIQKLWTGIKAAYPDR